MKDIKKQESVTNTEKEKQWIEIYSKWDFSGGPVAKTLCRGPGFNPGPTYTAKDPRCHSLKRSHMSQLRKIPQAAMKADDPTCHS